MTKLAPLQRRVLAHLKDAGPASAQELAFELGSSREGARTAIADLHTKGLVFIKDWPYQGQQRTRLWAVRGSNNQADAPRPPPMTAPEYQRRWRDKFSAVRNVKRIQQPNIFRGLMT